MYYHEIGAELPTVHGGKFEYIELGVGRPSITVTSPGSDCLGAIVVDSMGQAGAGAQRVPVNGSATVTFGPVTGRVVVRVECSAGNRLIIT